MICTKNANPIHRRSHCLCERLCKGYYSHACMGLFFVYLCLETGVRNITIHVREGRPPNSSEMMALKVIMLVIVTGAILKEIVQVTIETLCLYVLVHLIRRQQFCT